MLRGYGPIPSDRGSPNVWAIRHVVALVLVTGILGINLWSADYSKEIERAEGLAKSGKSTEVKNILDALAVEPDGKPYAALIIARLQFSAGKGDLAQSALQKEFPTAEAVKRMPAPLQIAYGKTLLIMRRHDEAAAIADRIGSESSNISRVQAAELLSDVFSDRRRWQGSLDWITVAVNTLDSFKYSDEERTYLAALRAKRQKIEQVIDLLTHGLGFKLYQEGNTQRFAKQYTKAIATYDKLLELHEKNKGKPIPTISGIDDTRINDFPIHDIYAAAAQMYRGYALIGLSQFSEAEKSLIIVAQCESNPYRGEALRALGDIALEYNGDAEKSESLYSSAIQALQAAEEQAKISDGFRVPDGSRQRTKPPEEMRSYKGWGNLEWYKPEPNQMVNADTCSWYVDYQVMHAQAKRSLCRFLRRDLKGAEKDLEAIDRYDAHDARLTAGGMPSNYLRLRDGYRSGGLFASDAELQSISPKMRPFILLGDFYIEMEAYAEAEAVFGRLRQRFSDRLKESEKAYVQFALLAISSLQGNFDNQVKECDAFLSLYGKCPSAPRVWMLKAARTNQKERPAVYQQIADTFPGSEYQLDALMHKGMMLSEGSIAERSLARLAFESVCKLAPKTAYDTAAKSFLLEMTTKYGER